MDRDEIIRNLAEKYDICIHEVKDALKIAKDDFGAKSFDEQISVAEKEIFSQFEN